MERVYIIWLWCALCMHVEGYENDSVPKPEEQWADTVLDPRWSLSSRYRPSTGDVLLVIFFFFLLLLLLSLLVRVLTVNGRVWG